MTGAGQTAVGLADTSLFIALEQERPLAGAPPERIAVSVITIAELRLGVLAAADASARARRLDVACQPDGTTVLPGGWDRLVV